MGTIKKIIKKIFYDKWCSRSLYPFSLEGQLSLKEKRVLLELVKESNQYPGPIIEIGTLFGATALILCLGKDLKKKIIAVDNFQWNPCGISPTIHEDLTQKILAEAQRDFNLQLLKINKADFYQNYLEDTTPSLVFLDADHSYTATLEDLTWAKSIGAKIIAGHDYKAQHPGVIQAVEESFDSKRVTLVESIYVIRKDASLK